MSNASPSPWQPWLRAGEQLAVATLLGLGLAVIGLQFWWQGGTRGRLIEIEKAAPRPTQYWVDINTAQVCGGASLTLSEPLQFGPEILPEADDPRATAIRAAKSFLRQALADGPKSAIEMRKAVLRQSAFSLSSLYRVADRVGVIIEGGVWRLA